MNIYGYGRVSGKIQIKNNSFADQEKQMREKYGDALKFYKEQYTGSTTDRPVLNEVMGMLESGDIFVVTKLDRLARTTLEGLELIQKLFSMGVTVHILNIGILENTSMGQFFITCLLAVAELERVMIIERMMSGREIAAGKLHKILPQKAVVIKGHQALSIITLLLTLGSIVMSAFFNVIPAYVSMIVCLVVSTLFGILFAIRVGGADMPVVISLLNSLSGVAAGIAGIAIGDYLLVAVGGIVGASGLLLTQIMCKSMNRKLSGILFGKAPKSTAKTEVKVAVETKEEKEEPAIIEKKTDGEILKEAKEVIIVPTIV